MTRENSTSDEHCAEKYQTALDARIAIRAGDWTSPTAGIALDYVQGNVVILPKAYAFDFLNFCISNPKPCPLLAVSDAGSPHMATLGENLDIRTDVPKYVVYRSGVADTLEPTDITSLWRDDLVTFVLGCSFSFEAALMEAGIPLWHVEHKKNVAMYDTSIQCHPAGKFSGNMVVSMRPMTAEHVIRAVQVTAKLPRVHGAPIHIGDPQLIGIGNIEKPDYGDPVPIGEGQIPVFWACGVTPQNAIKKIKPEFCITHAAGHMLVTDLLNRDIPF